MAKYQPPGSNLALRRRKEPTPDGTRAPDAKCHQRSERRRQVFQPCQGNSQMSRECRQDYYRDRREARQQHLRIMDRVLIGVVVISITVIIGLILRS